MFTRTPPYVSSAKYLVVKETKALDKLEYVESYVSATEKGYQSKFLITLKDGYYFSALENVHKQYCFNSVNDFKKAKPIKKPEHLDYSDTSAKNTIIWVLIMLRGQFHIEGISLCDQRRFAIDQTYFEAYGNHLITLNSIQEVFKSFKEGKSEDFLSYRVLNGYLDEEPDMVVFQLPDTMTPSLELTIDIKPEWFV